MKDSYYFPHDYHARHDPKLEKLMIVIGCEGIGIYWCLIEMLYENNGYLKIEDIPFIAKSLNTDEERLKEIINDYNLFKKDGEVLTSSSMLIRLKHINLKRWKAKVSANKRWKAEAMRTHNEGNAIKERKVKERKVKERKEEFTTEIGGLILKNSFLETIKTSYPNLNLDSEIRACITWHKTNNPRCKHWTNAINNWLKKSQEKIGVVGEIKPTITLRRPL